jgi:hypothetical protein
MGMWARDGLTQDQYDNGVDSGDLGGVPGFTVILPNKIKNYQPYIPQLPTEDFRAWQRGPFDKYWRMADHLAQLLVRDAGRLTTWDSYIDLDEQEEP